MLEFISSALGVSILILGSAIFILFHFYMAKKTNVIKIKTLVVASLCIALATITSNIKLFSMASGGSVTLFSMFFITIVGTMYGGAMGVVTGIVYGFIQILMGAHIVSVPQVLIDYILAFGVLGISGYFRKTKYSPQIGYLVGTFLRFLLSSISGFLFYLYNPNALLESFVGSLVYNASYMIPEMVLTLIIISLPIMSNMIKKIMVEYNQKQYD